MQNRSQYGMYVEFSSNRHFSVYYHQKLASTVSLSPPYSCSYAFFHLAACCLDASYSPTTSLSHFQAALRSPSSPSTFRLMSMRALVNPLIFLQSARMDTSPCREWLSLRTWSSSSWTFFSARSLWYLSSKPASCPSISFCDSMVLSSRTRYLFFWQSSSYSSSLTFFMRSASEGSSGTAEICFLSSRYANFLSLSLYLYSFFSWAGEQAFGSQWRLRRGGCCSRGVEFYWSEEGEEEGLSLTYRRGVREAQGSFTLRITTVIIKVQTRFILFRN